MLNAHLSFFTGEALGKVFTERGGLPVWSSKLDLLRSCWFAVPNFCSKPYSPLFSFLLILVRGKKYSRQWGSYEPRKNEWKLVYSMRYIEMLMMWSVKKSMICKFLFMQRCCLVMQRCCFQRLWCLINVCCDMNR